MKAIFLGPRHIFGAAAKERECGEIRRLMSQSHFPGPVSHRSFLKSAAVCGLAYAALPSVGGFSLASKRRRTLAHVGTDTSPVDGTANGKKIYLFEMGSDTGELTPVKLAAETATHG